MSKKDLQRIEVLTEVLAGRWTTESAAGVLNVSLRQTQRLRARYEDGGGAALIHKARGRPATMLLALLVAILWARSEKRVHVREGGGGDAIADEDVAARVVDNREKEVSPIWRDLQTLAAVR